MTYTSSGKSMSENDFINRALEMYLRCDKPWSVAKGKMWYHDFGHIPGDVLVDAFKRLEDSPPRSINKQVIKQAIADAKPKREETGTIGCTYCDCVGCIDYFKEINNVKYQYSARCHKCKTSRYTNLPYYNEVFPNDDIKPHSTPEQMKCGKHIVQDVVKLITGREHADAGQEVKRSRQLYREKTL